MKKEVLELQYNLKEINNVFLNHIEDCDNGYVSESKKVNLTPIDNINSRIKLILKLNKKQSDGFNPIQRNLIFDDNVSNYEIKKYIDSHKNIYDIKRFLVYLILNDKNSIVLKLEKNLSKYKELKTIFKIANKIK